MPAAAIIGSAVVGAGANIYGAQTAAGAQRDATNSAANTAREFYLRNQENLQPFINAGKDMLPTLQRLLSPGDQTATLSELPGFKFAQDWGQKAVANQYSGRGGGGNAIKAAADYATGVAQQGYTGYADILQKFINSGEGAAATLAGGSTAAGSQVGGYQVGGGNATAGGNMATGNAIAGAAGGFGNLALLDKLTGGQLFKGGGGGMYGTPAQTAGTLEATNPGNL